MSDAGKRRDARYHFSLPMKLRNGSSLQEVVTDNVSYRGLFVRTAKPPAERQLVVFEASLPPRGEKFTSHAMVVFSLSEDAAKDGAVAGAGIQFYATAAGERKKWEAFVNHVKKQPNAKESWGNGQPADSAEGDREMMIVSRPLIVDAAPAVRLNTAVHRAATVAGGAAMSALSESQKPAALGTARPLPPPPRAVVPPSANMPTGGPRIAAPKVAPPAPPPTPRSSGAVPVFHADEPQTLESVVLAVAPTTVNELAALFDAEMTFGSLFIAHGEPPRTGALLQVDVEHPDTGAVFSLPARVTRVHTSPSGVTVEFIDFGDDTRIQVKEFIDGELPMMEDSLLETSGEADLSDLLSAIR